MSDGRFVLTGTPNEKGDVNPYDVIRGSKGSVLRILDGQYNTVQEIALSSLVRPDGMAASNGRLFLAHEDGVLSCWQ